MAETVICGAWSLISSQQNIDPLSTSAMEVDAPIGQKPRPSQLILNRRDTMFSDPWETEKPLTPLDQEVPQWYQRRKLAITPDDAPQSIDHLPVISSNTNTVIAPQEKLPVSDYQGNALKRTRSSSDLTESHPLSASSEDEVTSPGQVMNEWMGTPTIQSAISKKRKVVSKELEMNDLLAGWQRNFEMNTPWTYGYSWGRDVGLTALDFCSWNLGFDLRMATGKC